MTLMVSANRKLDYGLRCQDCSLQQLVYGLSDLVLRTLHQMPGWVCSLEVEC